MKGAPESRTVFPYGLTIENPSTTYAIGRHDEEEGYVPTITVQLDQIRFKGRHRTVAISYTGDTQDYSVHIGIDVIAGRMHEGVVDFASQADAMPLQEKVLANLATIIEERESSLAQNEQLKKREVKRRNRSTGVLAVTAAALASSTLDSDIQWLQDSVGIIAPSIVIASGSLGLAASAVVTSRELQTKLQILRSNQDAARDLHGLVSNNELYELRPGSNSHI